MLTAADTKSPLDRRSGVAVWRQIADELRADISNGEISTNDRLPPEFLLAKRFDVNRHTVRAAIASLADEGIVESRQGQGTFVMSRARIAYPISSRTRFSQGVSEQAKTVGGQLLAYQTEAAGTEIAAALNLKPDSRVIRLETLSKADDRPISRSTSWFCARRFGQIAKEYRRENSITKALNNLGVDDYFRKTTGIEARHANVDDANDLALSPGGIVLITEYLNCDGEGKPIQFARTRFAADRVSLTVDNVEMGK